MLAATDKRTDVSSRNFIIWKINSGLWAVVWDGLWNKRVWADYEQLLMLHFLSFHGQKINLKFFWKHFRVLTKKLHRIKVKKVKNILESIFYVGKNQFFRAKNLSVNTWRLGPDICSLICACSLLCVLLYCIQSDLVNSLLHLGSKIKQKQMHYYAIKIWYLIRILVVENVGMLQFHFHTFPFIFISNMFLWCYEILGYSWNKIWNILTSSTQAGVSSLDF